MKIKVMGLILIGVSITILVIYSLMYFNINVFQQIQLEKKIKNTSYYAIIEIDKINLKREIYPIDDKNNDINKNILNHSYSIFPNAEASNIILAAHSGYALNAFFKDLYKLNINDEVHIYYDNQVFTYQIKEIEYQDKTGTLYLKEDFNNMLTLITCTHNDKNKQTIYYANLIECENI